jgi:hypothetical protein
MSLKISNDDFLNGDVLAGQTTDNPIIFYNSICTPEQLTGITENFADNPAINLWSPETYNSWRGAGYSGVSANYNDGIIFHNINEESINFMAIAGHNLADVVQSGTALFLYAESSSNGISYTNIDPTSFVIPSDNSPIVFYFNDNSDEYFRLRMQTTTTSSDTPYIAHFKAGNATVLQRREFSGVESGFITKDLRRSQNISDSGQYLGDVILSSKRMQQINQTNNTPVFVRNEVVSFISHTQGVAAYPGGSSTTFFYSWRPSKYPDDVLYGWTKDTIRPSHEAGDSFGGRMSWSLSMECLT